MGLGSSKDEKLLCAGSSGVSVPELRCQARKIIIHDSGCIFGEKKKTSKTWNLISLGEQEVMTHITG